MPINLGIIGLSAKPTAWATIGHISPLKSKLADKYAVTAIAGSSEANVQTSAKAFGLSQDKAYSDAEQLAKDADVQMVVVAVKVPEHKKLALPALTAGKDVFVEWPLGNGLDEARELAAKAKGIKTVVGLQARFAPSIVKAHELIKSGALGSIVSTNVTGNDSLLFRLPESNAYMANANNGANFLTITCGHALDALCFLLGEFEWLSAKTHTNFPECQVVHADKSVSLIPRSSPDYLALYGRLKSAVDVAFTYSTTSDMVPGGLQWAIIGEKGALKLEGQNCMLQVFPPKLFRSERVGEGEECKWEEVMVELPMAFGGVGEVYDAFASGNGVGLVDFDMAVTRHEMLDAICRSAETGRREPY